MLYLIATPIGNLGDFSKRAVEVLKKVDLILCEDTRRSSILLAHYEIKGKLASHHKFNEQKSLQKIIAGLNEGKDVALISDAGTPCINDPGQALVAACIEENIPFTLIPGPCSPISALVLSGVKTDRFQYVGFLPKKGLEAVLKSALFYPGATVALESPERIGKTVSLLAKLDPERSIAIVREMTKTFEECIRGRATDVEAKLKEKKILGEVCLVIDEGNIEIDLFTPDALVLELQENFGLNLKEAIQTAAKLLKKPKREVYKSVVQNSS